jgi:hypothetical protein
MPIRSEIFESRELFFDNLRGATRHESASRSDYPEENPKQWENVKISRFHGALILRDIYRAQLSGNFTNNYQPTIDRAHKNSHRMLRTRK